MTGMGFNSLQRFILSLALAVVLVPALAAAGDPSIEGDEWTFAFPDLEGRTVSSSDPELRDKVLLVDLWGTWCPPCVSEIPTFIDLQERLGERGLVIVAIAFESDEDVQARRERLREYVAHYGINYLVLDGGSPEVFGEALPELKNVRGFPIEIVLDREGGVVDVRNGYGYKKRWARKLEGELVELLDGASD
jgi:thiol-disulfide isomerase/thioredoxin